MYKHWQYLKYVLRHKWFVLLAGLQLGVPLWMLILHDWDKFLPSMWFPYANYFYGNLPKAENAHLGALAGLGIFPYTREDCERDFARAWNDHQKRNKHHWQRWMLVWDRGETECLPMPNVYIREMVADWRGAGRANGKLHAKDTADWYWENHDKIKLHSETRQWVEFYIEVLRLAEKENEKVVFAVTLHSIHGHIYPDGVFSSFKNAQDFVNQELQNDKGTEQQGSWAQLNTTRYELKLTSEQWGRYTIDRKIVDEELAK